MLNPVKFLYDMKNYWQSCKWNSPCWMVYSIASQTRFTTMRFHFRAEYEQLRPLGKFVWLLQKYWRPKTFMNPTLFVQMHLQRIYGEIISAHVWLMRKQTRDVHFHQKMQSVIAHKIHSRSDIWLAGWPRRHRFWNKSKLIDCMK